MIGSRPADFQSVDSRSRILHEKAARYLPGGTSKANSYIAPNPFWADRGEGFLLIDVDGVPRLDFLNCFSALIHGHADPDVTRTVIEQLHRGTAFSAPSEPEVELASILVERVPSLDLIRFTNSGTEAVMMAVKAARAFTGRDRIAKFEGFYHGYYDDVQVSFAGNPSSWGEAETPAAIPNSKGIPASTLGDVVVLPFGDWNSTERLIRANANELAAVVIDPLSQAAGFLPQPDGYWKSLRELTADLGILLVADEVISFRVSYVGAQAHLGFACELTAFGKVIGGGFPVGAVGGRQEVMDVFNPSHGKPAVPSGGTFSANPVTMAAGRAAMEKLTPSEFDRLASLGSRLRDGAAEVLRRSRINGSIRGAGSLFRILPTSEVTSYRSVASAANAAAKMTALHLALLDEGLVVNGNGFGALSTPMGDREVDAFLERFERAVARVTDLWRAD